MRNMMVRPIILRSILSLMLFTVLAFAACTEPDRSDLVILNRDERGPRLQGLRNLTFNATVMPMVTVLNPLTIYYDENLVKGFGYERDHLTRHSHPQLNYTATVGMALSIDRLGFNARFHYDNFHFNTGLQTDNLNNLGKEYSVQQNRMKGRFYNWGVEAEMQIKF